jgi:hypothetical protein
MSVLPLRCFRFSGSLSVNPICFFAVIDGAHAPLCCFARRVLVNLQLVYLLKVFLAVLRLFCCIPTIMRALILSSFVAVCCSQWPIPFVLGPDTAPNVEVSLDAPAQALPDVSAEVGRLEADREAKQSISSNKMIRAFNKELGSARSLAQAFGSSIWLRSLSRVAQHIGDLCAIEIKSTCCLAVLDLS